MPPSIPFPIGELIFSQPDFGLRRGVRTRRVGVHAVGAARWGAARSSGTVRATFSRSPAPCGRTAPSGAVPGPLRCGDRSRRDQPSAPEPGGGIARVNQPVRQLCGSIGDIAGNVVGRQSEAVPASVQHGPGGLDFLGDARRCRFHIDDYRVLHVDEIVETVTEHHLVSPPRGPGGGGIGRRQCAGLAFGIDRRCVAVQRRKIFANRPADRTRFAPIDLALNAGEAAGIRLDHRGIHGKTFAAHQTRIQADVHDMLKHPAQHITIPEPAMTVQRKRRVIGNPVLQSQPAEPAVGEIKLDFLAQAPLGPDPVAVTHQQHTDHQLGIDRRAARMTVIGSEFAAQPVQVKNRGDPAQQMIRRDHIV